MICVGPACRGGRGEMRGPVDTYMNYLAPMVVEQTNRGERTTSIRGRACRGRVAPACQTRRRHPDRPTCDRPPARVAGPLDHQGNRRGPKVADLGGNRRRPESQPPDAEWREYRGNSPI